MKENPMTTIYLMLLLLHAHLSICNGLVSVSVVGLNSVKNNEIEAIPKRDCGESSRRVLVMQKKYISYETLKKDMIPCARPGASYYNCRASGEANPYNRGCEVITGCARGVRDINS
ncbi:hypothetical protein AAG906_021129 [Vitis piasezkii]